MVARAITAGRWRSSHRSCGPIWQAARPEPVLSKWRRPAAEARSSSVMRPARASSQISAGPAGSPSASTSQVPSPCAVTPIAATRDARSGTLVGEAAQRGGGVGPGGGHVLLGADALDRAVAVRAGATPTCSPSSVKAIDLMTEVPASTPTRRSRAMAEAPRARSAATVGRCGAHVSCRSPFPAAVARGRSRPSLRCAGSAVVFGPSSAPAVRSSVSSPCSSPLASTARIAAGLARRPRPRRACRSAGRRRPASRCGRTGPSRPSARARRRSGRGSRPGRPHGRPRRTPAARSCPRWRARPRGRPRGRCR